MERPLTSNIKEKIQLSYSSWLTSRDFLPRSGQKQMIAGIVKTLTGSVPRIAVFEAGTGTGKTAAYCVSAIPLAKSLDRTLVISTATIALQEQVMFRDLPDITRNAELDFSATLAKGRRRYVCLKRLDTKLREAASTEVGDWFGVGDFDKDQESFCSTLLSSFANKQWNGDRDTWSGPIDDQVWITITTDHRGCTNNKCSFFKQCPFFKAREKIENSDVLVVNHDLLLADLSLGGGVVLPAPSECIYIIDEAHRLQEKTQQHFSISARARSSRDWADNLAASFGTMTQRLGRPATLVGLSSNFSSYAQQYTKNIDEFCGALAALKYADRNENLSMYRFRHGHIPEDLMAIARKCSQPLSEMLEAILKAIELLQENLSGGVAWKSSDEVEDWLLLFGQGEGRARATLSVLVDYGSDPSDQDLDTPYARWINNYGDDFEIVSLPLDSGNLLSEFLWEECYGAICTSATLSVGGKFNRFLNSVGLQDVEAHCIPSPFNFGSIAKFYLPSMQTDPRDLADHCIEVSEMLPSLLEKYVSALVLFSSWRQLKTVTDVLSNHAIRKFLKIQGDSSKYILLEEHRKDIDEGRKSYIFGLASFSEGLDLPDDYCRHVVIARLPFSVPDDPISEALSEWVNTQGKNPFYEISLPDAALRLVQACGRLIRHENDFGQITMLDRRLVSQRYGHILLDSLPPYDFVVEDS